MKIKHLGWFLILLASSGYAQETSEKNLLQNDELFFEQKNRVETRGFADPALPSPDKKKKPFVSGGEAEVSLKKKKGKPKAADADVEYDDIQMTTVQTREDPKNPKPKPKKIRATVSPKEFVVKTFKVGVPKSPDPDIKLVFPPHNSTLTSGIIKFEWDSEESIAKKKMDLIVERLSSRERYIHRSGKLNKKIYFGPGEYRWQVACPSQGQESRWRIFRVVNMKSERRPSGAKK